MTNFRSAFQFYVTVLCLVLWVISPIWAQQEGLGWKKYVLDSPTLTARTLNSNDKYWIVQTSRDMKSSEFALGGIQLFKKLDHNIYLVQAENSALDSVDRVNVWKANNFWKLASISDVLFENPTESGTFTIQVDTKQPRAITSLDFINPISEEFGIYTYTGSLSYLIAHLIANPAVLSITQESFNPRTEALVRDMNLMTNRVNKVHRDYTDLDGRGQVISIQENLYDITDIDIRARHAEGVAVASQTVDAHATDMATIIAGAGNSFLSGRGVLKAAHTTSSDFIDVLPDTPAAYEVLDIKVQNHSYGTEIESFYGTQAQAYDASAYENPYLLHIFSSGNSGLESSPDGTYSSLSGWANLTGNYKMSKNTLSVGAIDFENNEVTFSSRGPAYDGRIKPELVAYGQDGSSNAAALVSGISGLLHQAYHEETGVDLPSALLKAYLVNTADDAGTIGLDHTTGYGSVNAHKSLETLLAQQHFLDTVSFGETLDFSIEIPEHTRRLKVTLCWTDPAALVGNTTALINDLDLSVTTPHSDLVLPWALSTVPNDESLRLAASRSEDHLNNLEQITIDNPESGTYTIQVSGYDVPEGAQAFAIAYDLEEKEVFEWDYPAANDPVPFDGGSNAYLYWSSTFDEDVNGILEYSLDSLDWITLSSQVSLSKGYWYWEDVPVIYEQALLKMTIEENAFESEEFIISRPTPTSLGFDCTDSIMFQWDAIPDAIDYEILNLGNLYLEPYATTSDSFMIIDVNTFNTNYISVRAHLTDEQTTIPSYTVDYTHLAGTCYISFLFQEEAPNEGIYVHLELGTTLGIASVQIDRKHGDEYLLVDLIPSVDMTSLSILDDEPNEGLNEHRATVILTNGEQVTMSASSAYYFIDNQVLVFPNPVSSLGNLNIFRAESTTTPVFTIYNNQGQKVFEQTVPETKETIPDTNLAPGIYPYTLELDNQRSSGRLIIN